MRQKEKMHVVEVRGVYVRRVTVWAKSKGDAIREAARDLQDRGRFEDYSLGDAYPEDSWSVWCEAKD